MSKPSVHRSRLRGTQQRPRIAPGALWRGGGLDKMKTPNEAGGFIRGRQVLFQAGVDVAEDPANLGAQGGQNTNDNNGDQYQDQRVLDQTLTILFGEEAAKHCGVPFEMK
jgi:hypothetical protein